MITPQFSVSQDDEFIHIEIRAPYIKATNIEFHVDGELFIFSLNPYYLRLKFPGNLVDDEERSKTSYDLQTSTVHAYVPKETKGKDFPDLHMLNKLLSASEINRSTDQANTRKKPLIQEIANPSEANRNTNDNDVDTYDANFSWELPQSVQLNDPILGSITGFKYGFDDQYTGIIGASILAGNDINELEDPEHTPLEGRTKERLAKVNAKFDPDYYLADYHDNPMIQELIDYKLPTFSQLTKEDNEAMLKLSTKHYLLDHTKSVYTALVSILYGIAYDLRTTMDDPTVESPWTIAKLSPQMCFLDNSFANVKQLLEASIRQTLCYPLYRHWGLSLTVIGDILGILKQGRTAILHYLLRAYRLFNSEQHQVYNTIFLEDYIVWLQMDAKDLVIQSLASEVEKALQSGFDKKSFEIGDYTIEELEELEQLEQTDGLPAEGLPVEMEAHADSDDEE